MSAQLKVSDRYDAIVVGSGMAGSLMAAKLSAEGLRVLIVEAGPERTLKELYSSQIWARKLKWRGTPVEESGDHRIEHVFNAGYGTGGSAIHHYGVWLRLHENDFNVASEHGMGLDWPINYGDLRPYYDEIQHEIGISGDAKAEKWRPAGDPYPLPPLPLFPQGQTLKKAFTAAGRHTAPLPVAINTRPRNGRAACSYDGWCDAGCPTGALANPLATYLPVALANGAQLIHDAEVIRVLRDASNAAKVTGVEYIYAGERRRAMASKVVLCAFPVQNARILHNSADDRLVAPGNEHDQLGRYLMTHPAGTVFGLFEDDTAPHQGVSAGALLCHDHYADKQAIKGAFGSYQWLIAQAAKPNDLLGYGTSRPDIYGAALEPFLTKAASHLANMTMVGEDIPQAKNRIVLSDNKDPNGVPVAHASHDTSAQTVALWDHAMAEGRQIMSQGGAIETWQGPRVAMHIMGGTVMGKDPQRSVTDEYGRVHSMENLYVAGSGLFPSGGAVNPTFTLSALALRTARHIVSAAAG